jgi:hypothetical protein
VPRSSTLGKFDVIDIDRSHKADEVLAGVAAAVPGRPDDLR